MPNLLFDHLEQHRLRHCRELTQEHLQILLDPDCLGVLVVVVAGVVVDYLAKINFKLITIL